LYQAAKRGCMIAGSDRAVPPFLVVRRDRFDSPDDARPGKLKSLGR